jgi:hypothetical protein
MKRGEEARGAMGGADSFRGLFERFGHRVRFVGTALPEDRLQLSPSR